MFDLVEFWTVLPLVAVAFVSLIMWSRSDEEMYDDVSTTQIVAVCDGEVLCGLAVVPDAEAWDHAVRIANGRRKLVHNKQAYVSLGTPFYSSDEGQDELEIHVNFEKAP